MTLNRIIRFCQSAKGTFVCLLWLTAWLNTAFANQLNSEFCQALQNPNDKLILFGQSQHAAMAQWQKAAAMDRTGFLSNIAHINPASCPTSSIEFQFSLRLLSKDADDFALIAKDNDNRPYAALALGGSFPSTDVIKAWITSLKTTDRSWPDLSTQLIKAAQPNDRVSKVGTELLKDFYYDRILFYQNPDIKKPNRPESALAADLMALHRIFRRAKAKGVEALIKQIYQDYNILEISNFDLSNEANTSPESLSGKALLALALAEGAELFKDKKYYDKLKELTSFLSKSTRTLEHNRPAYAILLSAAGLARSSPRLKNPTLLKTSKELLKRYDTATWESLLDASAYILAAIEIAEAELTPEYLVKAHKTAEKTLNTFISKSNEPGYRDQIADSPLLGIKTKSTFDQAWPSPNGLFIWGLTRLKRIFPTIGNERIDRDIGWLASTAKRHPGWVPLSMLAIDIATDKAPVAIVATSKIEKDAFLEAHKALRQSFLPNASMFFVQSGSQPKDSIFENKMPLKQKTTYFVCVHSICHLPVWKLEEAINLLSGYRKYRVSRKHL